MKEMDLKIDFEGWVVFVYVKRGCMVFQVEGMIKRERRYRGDLWYYLYVYVWLEFRLYEEWYRKALDRGVFLLDFGGFRMLFEGY